MQSNSCSNSPKDDMLKSFPSVGRIYLIKDDPDQLVPSSSSSPQPIKRRSIRSPPRIAPSIAFNLRLIELVKHRRTLYDGTSPGGRSSHLRLQMWDGLAMQLEYEKGGFSLQKRWKQIRDKYVKERRAVAERASGPLRVRGSSWPLYNKLSFLDAHLIERSNGDRASSPSPLLFSSSRPRGSISATDVEDFNRRVIEAVRAQPTLYSKNDPNYTKTDQRLAAWHCVLTDLNFPCDTTEIQKYWKSIRDRYIRIRRSLQDHTDGMSMQYSGKMEAVRWVHYNELSWLEPFLELRQRLREESVLSRQQADRIRRGLVALADEEDDVVVDYEVDRESVEASHLYSAQAELLEAGVRFDGDTAYAASVIADIRALPEEQQAHVRARIEMALEAAPSASGLRERKRRSDEIALELQASQQLRAVRKREERAISPTPSLASDSEPPEEIGMEEVKERREKK